MPDPRRRFRSLSDIEMETLFATAPPSSTAVHSDDMDNLAALSSMVGGYSVDENNQAVEQTPDMINRLMALAKGYKVRHTPGKNVYNPLTRTAYAQDFKHVAHELEHGRQFDRGGLVPTVGRGLIELLLYGPNGRYEKPNTLENEANQAMMRTVSQLNRR